ncbi:MAG: hypothetical protein PF569_01400 [Candidatus Woesearchaeota archaeon]|jgi:hypothetical protein|nr:hypothetical protein [Candidatus Woesearchaeota archaeon]
MIYRKVNEAFRVRGLRVRIEDVIVILDNGNIDLMAIENNKIEIDCIYDEQVEKNRPSYWMTNSDILEMNNQIINNTEVITKQ